MELIAVMDLMAGQVVHARRGERSRYQPIVSPLCPGSSDPAALAAALLDASGGHTLYLADLDALQGRPAQRAALEAVLAVLDARAAGLWLDAGFADAEAADRLLQALGPQRARVRPVYASEALRDLGAARAALAGDRGRALLSLDRRGGVAMDPAGLWEASELWPDQLIVMTLDAVGAGSGPDLAVLSTVRERGRALPRPPRLIGAGGLRDAADAQRAAAAGASAWLVATALHEGRLGRGAAAWPPSPHA